MGAAGRSRRSVNVFVAGCLLAVLGCRGQIRAAPFADALLLSMDFDADAEAASPEPGPGRMVYDAGIEGRALDMAGSTNLLPIASTDTAWFSRDRSFSVAVWVRSAEVTEGPAILLSNADADDQWHLPAFTNWYNGRKPEDLEGALTAWDSLLEDAQNVPLIWGGDFNSVSHLDDGEGASGHSKLMAQAGFTDAYRAAHPDVRTFAGYSNPGNSARIDYVYFKGEKLTLLEAGPLVPDFQGRGETPGYPSDHLGIVARFTIR